ncbi:hypothetical protein N431DRAFT_27042 [Stipitochalara longipes BDJ]|nr:hypothetical protein N431DRAFT_27042 [Stipitochalara longipes BDJ]
MIRGFGLRTRAVARRTAIPLSGEQYHSLQMFQNFWDNVPVRRVDVEDLVVARFMEHSVDSKLNKGVVVVYVEQWLELLELIFTEVTH